MKHDWMTKLSIAFMWSLALSIEEDTEKGKKEFDVLVEILRDSEWPVPPNNIVWFGVLRKTLDSDQD